MTMAASAIVATITMTMSATTVYDPPLLQTSFLLNLLWKTLEYYVVSARERKRE